MRLFNSPTRFCEKNVMGNFTKLLYSAKRMFAKVCSVKFTNKESRKKEKNDCKNKMQTKPNAIELASALSLFFTQSTNIPINLGNARAVAPVINKKTNPT